MYKKFDVRDYQVGGKTPPTEIEELDIPVKFSQMSDERDKVKAFYNDMLNSQWYKNRLKNNGYGNGFWDKFKKFFNSKYDGVENIVKKRLDRINNTNVKREKVGIVLDDFGNPIDRPYQSGDVTTSYNRKRNWYSFAEFNLQMQQNSD